MRLARKAKQIRWLVVLAAALFFAGISLPMLTITKFYLVKNSFSVVSGIVELLTNGQFILFAILTTFTILLPVVKLQILFRLLSNPGTDNPKMAYYLRLMHDYGRWAMLDVLVVAVLVVTVKLGAIANVTVHSGLYVFCASVLLTMLITHLVVGMTMAHTNHSHKTDG